MGFEITSELIALTAIFSSLIIALFTVFIGPIVQERVRIKMEKDMRLWLQKEERFFNMLSLLDSYSTESSGPKAKEHQRRFLEAYRHLWLYASDEIIHKVNDFLLESGYKYEIYSAEEMAATEIIYSMRKAFYGDTKLSRKDVFLAMTIE